MTWSSLTGRQRSVLDCFFFMLSVVSIMDFVRIYGAIQVYLLALLYKNPQDAELRRASKPMKVLSGVSKCLHLAKNMNSDLNYVTESCEMFFMQVRSRIILVMDLKIW